MALQETLYFVRQFANHYKMVGALFPTSPFAGQTMASEMARAPGPRRILEVGPGTGAITAEIVRLMGPDDELVLCELNTEFVAYLGERLDTDPHFAARRQQITLLHMDVTALDRTQPFDFIISAIPFSNCPPTVVEAIFRCYQEILKPGGTLSFIEYAYLRALKRFFLGDEARREAEAVDAVVNRFVEPHLVRRDLVVRNIPPAWIRHLRFAPPTARAAQALAPLADHRRISLGEAQGLSTEAIPFLAGVLGVALLLGRWPRLRALAVGLAAAIAAFFRDPHRQVRPDPTVAYAAADGRVLAVERLHDSPFGPGPWWRISVFLAITDVHINRSPVAGRVVALKQSEGGYAIAALAAAEHNAAAAMLIEGTQGPCIVVQRVGILARRIVNWNREGALLTQGERFGLIRFGSRTDVYLPADQVEPTVKAGERVVAGISVIARYSGGESK